MLVVSTHWCQHVSHTWAHYGLDHCNRFWDICDTKCSQYNICAMWWHIKHSCTISHWIQGPYLGDASTEKVDYPWQTCKSWVNSLWACWFSLWPIMGCHSDPAGWTCWLICNTTCCENNGVAMAEASQFFVGPIIKCKWVCISLE